MRLDKTDLEDVQKIVAALSRLDAVCVDIHIGSRIELFNSSGENSGWLTCDNGDWGLEG